MLCKASNSDILSSIQDGRKPEFSLQNLDACGQSQASDESPFLEEKQEEEQVCPETINVQTSPGQVPQFA